MFCLWQVSGSGTQTVSASPIARLEDPSQARSAAMHHGAPGHYEVWSPSGELVAEFDFALPSMVA